MRRSASLEPTLGRIVLAWTDAISYVLVVVGLLTTGSLLVTLITGGDIVRVKLILFFGGWILLAISIAKLWPSRETLTSTNEPEMDQTPTGRDGRIQQFSAKIPPSRWVRKPTPHERISRGGKLFWASLATLALSFVLETVFGVA